MSQSENGGIFAEHDDGSKSDADVFEPDLEIINILKGDPLTYIRERLDKLIIGEDKNKLTLFLSKLSYLREEPTHENIKGASGVGKTHLVLSVLEAFPPEDIIRVSRVTPAWLDYMKDQLKHKILLVQQFSGAESAAPSFHIMLSEKGLILGTVKKSEGGWEPYNVETEGPISFTSTTTSVALDKQMETRTFSIFPDDSPEQTQGIQEQQMRFDGCPWEREEALNSVREVREIVGQIRDLGVKKVIIPCSELIELPSDKVRVRRDRPKLIELIKSLAMLRQWKRLIVEKDGVKYVIAEWKDAKDAMNICGEVLTETIRELSALEERILREAEKWFRADWFSARQIAGHIGRSQPTVRMCLNGLVDKGYVFLEREGRGRGMCNMYSVNENMIKESKKTLLSKINGLDEQTVKKTLRKWVAENRKNVKLYVYGDEGRLVRRIIRS